MSGPKRNPDKLNTIGVVVVGICGAVLVYVSIVALQAFYMNDTSEVQTMADYGGQDTTHRSIRTAQLNDLASYGPNPLQPGQPQSYHVSIDRAIKLVVDAAKVDPANLVPMQGRADKATIQPVFGRPRVVPVPAPPADGAGTAAPPADDAGAAAPMTPTGGQGQGGGPPPGTEGALLKDPGVPPSPARGAAPKQPAAPAGATAPRRPALKTPAAPAGGAAKRPVAPAGGAKRPAAPAGGAKRPAAPAGRAVPKQPAPRPATPPAPPKKG